MNDETRATIILRRFVEPRVAGGPCVYNAHGCCYTHWYHDYPCPVSEAKDFLKDTP